MKRLIWIMLGLVLIGSFSCTEIGKKEFIKKYGNSNFDDFKNVSVFVRDVDKQGNLIVFAYEHESMSKEQNGLYVITINKNQRRIKKTSCHLLKDSTNINRQKLEQAAMGLVNYSLGYLSVDENDNVFVSLKVNAAPNLVRFADIKYKTEKYKDWERVQDNWYEIKR